MKLNHKTYIVVLTTIVFLAGCTSVPQRSATMNKGDYQYLEEYLTWSILKKLDEHDVKGLSIAIIDGQKTVWKKGFGLADEERNMPASSKTVYRIGSISKVITATQIMLMHQSGIISIDNNVTNYINDFSVESRFKNTKAITLRALLSHHSGLPTDIIAGMWVQNPISLSELMIEIKGESLVSPPQTMYKYSNIGYSVLGRVIEVMENKPFSLAMNDHFFQPLGMINSSFILTPEIESLYAKGYRKGKQAERTSLRDMPAGSMLSNVEDMGQFIHFIFSDRKLTDSSLIQPATINEMFTPQYPDLALDFNHKVGLDWVLSGLASSISDTIVWHNGAATPHQAHISLLPNKKLGVVILANTDEASQFITDLGIKSLELAVEAKFGRSLPESKQEKDIISVDVDDSMLDGYAGNYMVFGNMTPINKRGNKLEIELWENKFDLIPVSNNIFVPQATALGFIPIPLLTLSLEFKTVQGKSLALLHGLPAPFAFQKVSGSAIPSAWKKRLGSYQANTLDEQFTIENLQLEEEDNILFFSMTVQGKSADSETNIKIALNPISDTEAVVIGLGNGEGGTVKVVNDGTSESIKYSGFTFLPVVKKQYKY